MPYKLEEDADALQMLSELRKFYKTDNGHIIRSILRARLMAIDRLRTL